MGLYSKAVRSSWCSSYQTVSKNLQHHSIHTTSRSLEGESGESVPKPTEDHKDKVFHIQHWEKEEENNFINQFALQKLTQSCNSHLCTSPSLDNEESLDHNRIFWKQFGQYYRGEVYEDFTVKNWKDGYSNSYTQRNNTKQSDEKHSCANSKENSVHTLSHVNLAGEAQMVDVSGKGKSIRQAVAMAKVSLGSKAFGLVKDNKMKKGDVLGVARVAGIMAAKRTWELIPLCHTLPLDHVDVSLELLEKTENGQDCHLVSIKAQAVSVGRTGVEMEALTAASVAALTVYDMCKAVTHDITISGICLVSKTGGKRDFFRMPS